MRKTLVLLIVAVAGLATACSSIQAGSNAAPGVSFTKYRTFSLAPAPHDKPKGMPGYSMITADQIRSEIGAALEAKGFRLVEDQTADMLVGFTVSGQPRTDVWGTSGWGWYGYGGGGNVTTSHYTEGQLTINIYDYEAHKLIWHGWATQALWEAQADNKDTGAAVDAILSKFPPEES